MLITLKPRYAFGSSIKKGDEASPSIILASRALLVKMLITIKLDGIFGSNFAY